jgi:hypothetical protein
MTKPKILATALIAAAMLATPAMARETHVTRHLADRTNATTVPDEGYVDGRACIPAPRVGAFASQPWDNGPPPCEPQAY